MDLDHYMGMMVAGNGPVSAMVAMSILWNTKSICMQQAPIGLEENLHILLECPKIVAANTCVPKGSSSGFLPFQGTLQDQSRSDLGSFQITASVLRLEVCEIL